MIAITGRMLHLPSSQWHDKAAHASLFLGLKFE
jgi:hypothetical protein